MSGVYQIYNPINNIGATFIKITEKEYESKTKKQEELIMACGSKKGGSKKGGKTGKTGK